jgi:hypothetical protein
MPEVIRSPLIDRAFMVRTHYHNAQKFMHDAHFSGHFLYYSPSSNLPVSFNLKILFLSHDYLKYILNRQLARTSGLKYGFEILLILKEKSFLAQVLLKILYL